MILYLLFSVLILSNVESQTANMTVEKMSKVDGNQTLREFSNNNSTMKPGHVTSILSKDEKTLIEDELENNQTSAFITEDDENFQDQENEFPGRHCFEDLLEGYIHMCGAVFHKEMMSLNTEDWCVLENIIRPYNNMIVCLEHISPLVGCYYPNSNIQEFFHHIHSYYFHNCSMEELSLVDAPHGLVITLTLIPVSLIPVLVYLVVWKSKVRVSE
ncbi:receptor activity-modifying protein 3 [Cottoperca gobio]|uniref:Receptor activity-modifying protein 3-like n=1 Tax=Cottoperca gobio TaxID=56716 RepID=A0A6J2RSF7_COTGO|nr:receptor activity-modifying protein 3-like [Cottoperca gobio]XP_029312265.1 receptor activity-modifying protein 3-like [Cottoperca gobio]